MNDLFGQFVKAPIGFDDFWSLVPHKIGKHNANKAWLKLNSADRALAQEHVTAFYAWFKATYPTASPLHPSTYLNGKRWHDVLENVKSHTPVDESAILKMCNSTSDAVRRAGREAAQRHGINVDAAQ